MISGEEKTPSMSKGKILIMEDDHLIRKSISKILAGLDYEVVEAAEGEEAVIYFKNAWHSLNPFNIVILDLTIKNGMGGAETMSKLLEIDPKVKAILASGHMHDPVTTNFKNHGFSGILTKPFEMEQLEKLVATVLNQAS